MKALFFVVLILLAIPVLAQPKSARELIDTFNSTIALKKFVLPGFLSGLFKNEVVNVFLTMQNQRVENFTMVVVGGVITGASRGHSAQPTVNMYMSELTLDGILQSHDVSKAFIAAFVNKDIVVKGVGFKKLKTGLFAVVRYVLRLFGLGTVPPPPRICPKFCDLGRDVSLGAAGRARYRCMVRQEDVHEELLQCRGEALTGITKNDCNCEPVEINKNPCPDECGLFSDVRCWVDRELVGTPYIPCAGWQFGERIQQFKLIVQPTTVPCFCK